MSAGSTLKRRALAPLLAILAAASVGFAQTAAGPQQDEDPEPEVLRLEARPVAPVLPPPASAGQPTPGFEYRIGRQDLIEIRVFELDELDQTVRVSDDGTISVPLLGRLQVAGLTKGEFEDMLARLLEERFVRDPQVTVFVLEYESRKVAVSGAVKTPGTYEMLGPKTLLEMISLAGGLDKDYADEIIIFRQDSEGTTHRVPIDLEELVYAANPALNVSLAPGDIVYVPTVEKIRIFVGGAVTNPNLYEIPRNEPVTVLKAITLAGGTTDRAAEKKVKIIRTDESGERVTFEVNLRKIKRGKAEDPILHKDDVVFVQEAFF